MNPAPFSDPEPPETSKQADATDLSHAVEGYLLWNAQISEAEGRAREFTDRLDWLTTSQRAEIEEHYIADRLKRARGDLERVAGRCTSLRAEYEQRYQKLRVHCVAWAAALYAGTGAITVLIKIW
ncbi:cytochrome C oxidase subunit I [Streptomyces sp. NPDC088788]|uniref:cytochrome C oxidase subunit I n=1 Tax=Streptomyces sp. NPDC088788 TaxID=3365898 RepID=UPI0037F4B545